MFERFTHDAREVVVDAQAHARRLGHGRIGTEHLLLALAVRSDARGGALRTAGLTAEAVEHRIISGRQSSLEADRSALAVLGIDLDRIVEAVESSFGPGSLDAVVVASSHRRRLGLGRVGVRGRARSRGRRGRNSMGESSRCGGVASSGHIPFSPRVKRSLELSLREALRLRQNFVGAEHLALGLLREGQGQGCRIVADVVAAQGSSLDALRLSLEEEVRLRV